MIDSMAISYDIRPRKCVIALLLKTLLQLGLLRKPQHTVGLNTKETVWSGSKLNWPELIHFTRIHILKNRRVLKVVLILKDLKEVVKGEPTLLPHRDDIHPGGIVLVFQQYGLLSQVTLNGGVVLRHFLPLHS